MHLSLNRCDMQHPFFSIIIPTYNRPRQLTKCLQSLTRLRYPRNCFEVIVVDDGSKLLAKDVVANVYDLVEITLLRQENAGPATARNTGAKQAKGTFLAFIDDDCQPDTDWLSTLAKHCIERPQQMSGGSTTNALSNNPYSSASQQLISYLYQYYNMEKGQARFFASNNMIVPAKLFWKLGGFDTSFPLAAGEDREFCDRWLFHGYQMSYAAEAVIHHAHAMTLHSFCRQHFNYGRGAFYFQKKRSERGQKHMKPEPFAFYRNLLLYPLSQSKRPQAWLLTGLMFVTQAANTVGFFFENSRQALEENKR